MGFNIIHSEKKLCLCCMEKHEVKTISVNECTTFKNEKICYAATYFYCDVANEFFANEEQTQKNDTVMKDAYRKKHNLLTSQEIASIRNEYGISQNHLSTLLGWGEKTITRYEGHQVQDAAHDCILKKIKDDPAWYIDLLKNAKDSFSADLYMKYYDKATEKLNKNDDLYLRKNIEALYLKFGDTNSLCGKTKLSIDKIIDVIRYFASSAKVVFLYKVKLMKMLWYADCLSYKKVGHSITGLAYKAFPMGAVPDGHKLIIFLNGVPCKEEEIGEDIAYKFELDESDSFPNLTNQEKECLDTIINKFGTMKKDEIVDYMHKETAYKETANYSYIDFKYANDLYI